MYFNRPKECNVIIYNGTPIYISSSNTQQMGCCKVIVIECCNVYVKNAAKITSVIMLGVHSKRENFDKEGYYLLKSLYLMIFTSFAVNHLKNDAWKKYSSKALN